MLPQLLSASEFPNFNGDSSDVCENGPKLQTMDAILPLFNDWTGKYQIYRPGKW